MLIKKRWNGQRTTMMIMVFILFSYLVMSLGIMRYNEVPQDVIFGTDTERVYHDFFDITGTNHYRTKVHPLLLLLVQPFMSIVAGVVHHIGTALAIVESLTGFAIVFFTNRILNELVENRIIVIILTVIFAFSFSQIIFISIPETFIFGGFTVAWCWYYVILHKDNLPLLLEGKRKWIMVFLGILCFGVTITNYMQFVIALLLVLYGVPWSKKEKIKKFLTVNCVTIGVATILSLVQKLVWRNGTEMYVEQVLKPLLRKLLSFWGEIPDFLLPLQVKLSHSSFEEKAYMNFDFNYDKIATWFDGAIKSPLLVGDCYWKWTATMKYPRIFLSEYTPLTDVVFGIFVLLLVIMTLVYCYRGKTKALFMAISCAYVYNIALHFVYGSSEAFMYTPHYLFLLIVIYGMTSDEMKGRAGKFNIAFLLCFSGFEFFTNIRAYNAIRLFIANYTSVASYSMELLCLGVILAIGSVYYIFHRWYIYKQQVLVDGIKYVSSEDGLFNCLLIYITICVLYMIFAFSASFIK